MRVTIIAAIGRNGELGQGGKLPWNLPSDLKHFKEATATHPVIMGRKTWESLPKRPLPGRTNIVVSARLFEREKQGEIAWFAPSPGQAIMTAKELGAAEAFVIGGAQIYEEMIEHADRLILTQIHADFPEADTFFPITSVTDGWKLARNSGLKIENGLSYNITTWDRA